ncbi:hypothetical protein [Actinomyces sp. oral taxon 448]|uniref:hypothetical protein n=1 Tax=Actinomyces sp. oral taxon 448 TaxID=712124 RepID=UPI0002188E66|nr:hypothetical protein [Actinomyces sp. oral taxon 448]EGQ74875.1 hypothetical protein HMPREF9062_0747 [Actinomyces sp. oral taxon 448 str. F0400]
MTAPGHPSPSDQSGRPVSGPTTRTFRPGSGFIVLVVTAILIVVLALAAAVTAALGVRAVSSVLGGAALIIVGVGLLAVLRVPARSLVVNAPRLRLDRNRARAARRRAREASAIHQAGRAAHPGGPSSAPGRDLAVPLTVPGTDIAIPESAGRRELTALDVVSGPVTTALAATAAGRAADERLAGTTAGEGLARVAQLLAGSVGFLLVALGLASILRQALA